MTEKYTVQIVSSSRELSKREVVKYKDFGQYTALPELLKSAPDFCFQPDLSLVLAVHNEYLKEGSNTDYDMYLFLDKEGNGFYTGSSSFYDSYMDIVREMEGEEEYFIGVQQKQSNNFAGCFYKAILI